jgi:hypothetical protein
MTDYQQLPSIFLEACRVGRLQVHKPQPELHFESRIMNLTADSRGKTSATSTDINKLEPKSPGISNLVSLQYGSNNFMV